MKKPLKIPLYFGDGAFGSGWGKLIHKQTVRETDLKQKAKMICKPCWELKYCPYGVLVEDFPLMSLTRDSAIEHNEYLKNCLKTGILGSGEVLDSARRKSFQQEVNEFNPKEYPVKYPEVIRHMTCAEFGHLCPAYFVAEPFTESKERRSQQRQIPRNIFIRVVRRDHNQCQKCGTSVLDKDIEIDHIIPFSKGGPTTESNLRVLCFKCNRSKGNKAHEFLHEDAISKQKLKS